MNLSDRSKWTYGAELEYADVDTSIDLLHFGSWNSDDNTIVNSNGIANDPKRKLVTYGGEINTTPTGTIAQQVDIFNSINHLTNPTANYRSNLHLHIRVPGLIDDLPSLKKLMHYIHHSQADVFNFIEDLDKFKPNYDCEKTQQYAMKRHRRRKRSHQTCVSEDRYEAIMASTTPREFYENHATVDKNGNRNFFVRPRAGINLRQLWDTNTVEFRHFPGTTDSRLFHCSLYWCQQYLLNALSPDPLPIQDLIREFGWCEFPQFEPLDDYRQEVLYEFTSVSKNPRKLVEDRLESLGWPTVSDSIDEVYNRYLELGE